MKTFTNHIAGINATGDQKALATEIDRFFASDDSAFLMLGYAGTGKTFMLDQLAHFLRSADTPFHLMAPTGRAAKVLAARTGFPAATIHRRIYRMDQLCEYKEKDQDGSETYKYFFDLGVNDDEANAVYIVDEASMVSDMYSEAEFFRFGSGYLLKDLIAYVNPDRKALRRKIIFCGDPAQLPPVNSRNSPALCASTLKAAYGLETWAFEMRDVVRQQAGSGILANATALRESIRSKAFNTFNIQSASDVTTVKSGAVLSPWLDARQQASPEQTMIVAYSNRQVKDYNDLVREHLFPDQKMIQPGDRILVVRNNYNQTMPLLNGEFGWVIAANDTVERVTVFLNKPVHGKSVNVPIDLCFRKVTLRFEAPESGVCDIDCLINENLLHSPEPNLSSDECKALYVDFKNRHPGVKVQSTEFKELLRTDERFNSLQIKYGYAVTCHKAQGGEWAHVFADFGGGQNNFTESYYRWAYTALTRAKGRLYPMNAPYFTRLTATREVAATEDIHARIEEGVLRATADAAQLPIPFPLPDDQPILRTLYYAATAYAECCTPPLRITGLRPRQYALDVTFASGTDSATASIYYKANDTVSRICFATGGSECVLSALQGLPAALEGRRIIPAAIVPASNTQPPEPASLPDDMPTHVVAFIQELKEGIKPLGIRLEAFSHPTPFHGRYEFTRADGKSLINYYFNGQGLLTRVIPETARSNSAELIEDILALSRIERAQS
jgi:hypothetical protein